jgi:hypothetical protein
VVVALVAVVASPDWEILGGSEADELKGIVDQVYVKSPPSLLSVWPCWPGSGSDVSD